MSSYVNRALRTLAVATALGISVAVGAQEQPVQYKPEQKLSQPVQAQEGTAETKYSRLSELSMQPGQTAIYLPLNGKRTVREALVMGTGILDDALLAKLEKEFISENGWKDRKPEPGNGSGVICYTAEEIPANYRVGDVLINSGALDVKEWPKIDLEAELNIPAFRWRIYQRVDNDANGKEMRVLLADWSVGVGNPFGGKGYQETPVGKNEIYALEHFPDYGEGHYDKVAKKWIRTKYVAPGLKSNPFQEWKFLYIPGTGFYFHGTNQEGKLKRSRRMLSHGCVRNYNQHMVDLAALVLRNEGKLDVHDRTCGHGKDEDWNQSFRLQHPIPALNEYDTIEVVVSSQPEKSYVAFYPNSYRYTAGQDEKSEFISLTTPEHLQLDLERAGYNSATLDATKIAETAKKMRSTSREQRVPVKSLLKPLIKPIAP